MIRIKLLKNFGLPGLALTALLCGAIVTAYSPISIAQASPEACALPSFVPQEPIASTPNTISYDAVAAGDFNEDGNPDLAAVKPLANEVAIFIGDGTGRFAAPTNFAVGERPGFVAVADFNGDHHPDFVTHNYEGFTGSPQSFGSVSIRLGDGAGSFGPAATFPSGFRHTFFPVNPGPLVVGDWNNDGNLDLAEANQGFFHSAGVCHCVSPNVSILMGDGAGRFAAPRTLNAEISSGDDPLRIAAGDVNGDGNLDLVTAHSHTLSILPGDGRSNFGPAVTLAPTQFESEQRNIFTNVFLEDFNGDGRPDIVTSTSTLGTNEGAVSVRLGGGAGNFSAARTYLLHDFFSSSMDVADFNADLDLDVIVGPWLLLGDGAGGLEAPRDQAHYAGSAVAGDVNGDGRQDLVTTDGYSITIFLNTCDASESPTLRLLTEENSARAIALDSVTFTRGPFTVRTALNFSPDQRTRVILFAVNLELLPGETSSPVTAQAEDAQHTVYPLVVEHVGRVEGHGWLTQVTVKLPDELESAGDVQVSLSLRGEVSNKALINIRAGGTPP